MVKGFSSKFMFQMEASSGITKYGRFVHLARLIVGFLFCFVFLTFTDLCGKQVLLNLGKYRMAVNVVECEFDLLGRIFVLQN